MIRRQFLKNGILAASATLLGAPLAASARALSGNAGSILRPEGGTGVSEADLSLMIVTDGPDDAIAAVENWLRGFARGTVRVQTAHLAGSHTGDVALFRGGRLVDYRTGSDTDVGALRRLAASHGLPRPIENPTLVRFEAGGNPGQATRADVIRNGVLIGSLPLDRDVDARRIESEHGHVILSIGNGHARITDASCKHKTCMGLGEIGSAGQSLACIPARIAVTLSGASLIDATTL